METKNNDLSKVCEQSDLSESMSKLAKLLSNRSRIVILCTISEEELCVSELANKTDLTLSAVSQHLMVLRSAELVKTRRDKQNIYYSLKNSALADPLHEIFLFCK